MMASIHQLGGCQYDSDNDYASSSSDDGADKFSCPTEDISATSAQKTSKRSKKKKVSKSQHSLDTMRQRVSHLMGIFEGNGWFIPMPDSKNTQNTTSSSDQHQMKKSKKNGGKVWSNRNYGADKKRQRKQSERVMLETRIRQLESVLRDEYSVENP